MPPLRDTSRSGDCPLIGLVLGDPGGIGPELIAKLLAEPATQESGHTVLVADPWLWEEGQRVAGTRLDLPAVESFAEARGHSTPVLMPIDSISREETRYGEANAAGGRSARQALTQCLDAAVRGDIDGICFGPLNKYAMKLGGMNYEDELGFFADYLGVDEYTCEFNTFGSIWTSRISSHIPLKDAPSYVTRERILKATRLTDKSLRLAGVVDPRIAVAAFNPHGGESGTCGREEIDTIAPAVEKAQAEGLTVSGPHPADTLFLKVRDGEYDAVVTMFHDQGQIAIKLLGFHEGVTVHGGLPIPITTPAHGTAYDIASSGKANLRPTHNAFKLACQMAASTRFSR
ncbi:4-hydroxythreonine-4-phosphate dehydrogenase PdxA [Modicisalibacter radicis]|uniref:4-hydroxythreonine-4-phosphate dehydrogenase PdxA n=1 Tax=Halomonas sp. EAR18 TaxID=2518972 RepID=UPI00109C5FC2|nr:4-hydroxythreonine-4-phosphate dehydrogenase PdxA [Halomonas sp. EAR18]